MKTILVSGASGVVGYGALKALKKSGLSLNLIGTTIYEDSVAPAFCDIFELAPKTSDENYIQWLSDIIKKHNVDMIIPAIEVDMIKWNDNREKILQMGVFALLNNENLIKLCADKWEFFRTLSASLPEFAIPSRLDDDFFDIVENFGLPFLVKPRNGFGSKGIVKITNEIEFRKVKQEFGDTIMSQPIVGNNDEEFTISGFFDKKSKLLAFQQLKRKLAKGGYTEVAEVSNLPGIREVLTKLAEVLHPVGPTNFQFRIDKGQMKLLEVNPRVSSSSSIRTAFGYNELSLSVDYFLNGVIPTQPEIKQGRAVRYIEDFIFNKEIKND